MTNPLNYSSLPLSPTDASGVTMTAAIGNQLMQSDAPGTPVSAGQHFVVAQDGQGRPMVFSLGSDGRMYLIYQDGDGSSGWSQVELSAGLTDSTGAPIQGQAIGMYQDPDTKKITLALAVATSSTDSTSVVYATYPNSPDTTDWSSFTGWVARPGSGDWVVSELLLGPGNGSVGLLAAVSADRATYFSISLNFGQSDSLWYELAPPSDADQILGMTGGAIGGLGGGFYMLYSYPDPTDADQTITMLRFTSFPVYSAGAGYYLDPLYRSLTPPQSASSIASGPLIDDGTASGTSELYVGAEDGVYQWTAGGQAKDAAGVQMAGTDQEQVVTELIVTTDTAGNTALWSLGMDETLFYQLREAGADAGAFSAPQPILQTASQIAAMRNDPRITDELFVVTNTADLLHMWRDEGSGLWLQEAIATQDTGNIVTTNSYRYQLQLVTDGALPEGLTLEILASGWCTATANGAAVTLDDTHPMSLTPDSAGRLTLVFSTETMDIPAVTITSSAFAETITLDASSDIRSKLLAMDADQWKSATYPQGPQAGQSVITADYQGNVDAAVALLSQLDAVGADLSDDTDTTNLATASRRLKHGEVLGVLRGSGGAQLVQGDDARAALASRGAAHRAALGQTASLAAETDSFGEAIVVAAGDMLSWLWQGVETVASIFLQAVEDVVWMVVEIAGVLFKFAFKVLSTVWRAFSWILKDLLGLTLSLLLLFVGLFMDWDSIETTQKVISNLTLQAMDFVSASADTLSGVVDAAFTALEDVLGQLAPIDNPAADQPMSTSASDNLNPTVNASMQGDPAIGYSSYHLSYSGILDASVDTAEPPGPIQGFISDVLMPAMGSISAAMEQVGSDLLTAFQSDSITLNELIGQLAVDVTVGLLDTVRSVFSGLLVYAGDLIDWLKSQLTSELHIPFLTPLFEKMADEDATLINLLAFLVAIPVTPVCKLVLGQAPFADGTFGLDTDTWQELGAKLGPLPTLALAATPASDAEESDEDESSGWWWYSHVGGIIAAVCSAVLATLDGIKAWTQMEIETLKAAGKATRSLEGKNTVIGLFGLVIRWGKLVCIFPPPGTPARPLEIVAFVLEGLEDLGDSLTALIFPGHEVVEGVFQVVMNVLKGITQLGILIWEMIDDISNVGMEFFTAIQAEFNDIGAALLGYAKIGPVPGKTVTTGVGFAVSVIGDLLMLARMVVTLDGDAEEAFHYWGSTPSS